MNAKDAVVASFATFSRIRVPARLLDAVDWRDGAALAGFPLVGVVEGLAMLAWALAASWLCLPTPIAAAVFTCLPVLVNGGIHLDGLCDVADAVCSHADRDRKLQILKDPRAGAFGVMALACYLLLFYSLAAGADPMQLVRMSISLPAASPAWRCCAGPRRVRTAWRARWRGRTITLLVRRFARWRARRCCPGSRWWRWLRLQAVLSPSPRRPRCWPGTTASRCASSAG